MKGVRFSSTSPIHATRGNRYDIACFIGLIKVRENQQNQAIAQWLFEQGWLNAADGRKAAYHRDQAQHYQNVPIPIHSWEVFEQLFAWEQQHYAQDTRLIGSTYMGAAVRSFFAQGGRQCYVIAVGEPLTISASAEQKHSVINRMLPGFRVSAQSLSRSDRTSWNGIGHLFGLPDVSFVCMPDLPYLLRAEHAPLPGGAVKLDEMPLEQFVECSEPRAPAVDNEVKFIAAPSMDESGFKEWQQAISQAARLLAQEFREVQLLASLPIVDKTSAAASSVLAFLHQQDGLTASLDVQKSLASRFVQLSYPWLITAGSGNLPGGVEPPEGVLAGLLARNALSEGSFRSATRLQPSEVLDVYPQLSRQQMYAAHQAAPQNASPDVALIERLSLFAMTVSGVRLVSDVTTSNAVMYRPANIHRILSMLIRASRIVGEDYVFANNGEQVWADIKQSLNNLLFSLYRLGALNGKQAQDAFFVRCDRTTMSQNDIDNGRVIVRIQLSPAAAIESMDVVLTLQQSGQFVVQDSSKSLAGQAA